MKKIYIASDHAGLQFKKELKGAFPEIHWEDLGTQDTHSTDYPDWADKVVDHVRKGDGIGFLVCGSGQGMAMRANRHPGVRAALCWDLVSTKLARSHNDANLLCLGARLIPLGLAIEMVRVFLATEFAGGRHELRVKKLDSPLRK